MAGGPITINYSADISDAVAGTDQLGDAMDKVGDAADDSAKQSGSAADKMLRSQQDAARGIVASAREVGLQQAQVWRQTALDAGRSTEQVETTYRQMVRSVETQTRAMTEQINTSTTKNIGDVERAAGSLRTNLTSGLAQAASSFDFSDPIASATGALNTFAAFVPGIGGVIGGALGSVAATMFHDWQENAQKSQERVKSMYDDMVQSGKDYLTESQINSAAADLNNDDKQRNQMKQDAVNLGLSYSTVLRANAGDQQALTQVQSKANSELDKANAAYHGLTAARQGQGVFADQDAQGAVKAEELAKRYQQVAADGDSAASRIRDYRAAVDDTKASSEDASKAAQTLGQNITQLPTTHQVKIGVDRSAYDREVASINGSTVHVNVAFVPLAGSKVY